MGSMGVWDGVVLGTAILAGGFLLGICGAVLTGLVDWLADKRLDRIDLDR